MPKDTLRRHMLRRRDGMSAEQVKRKSLEISRRFLGLKEFGEAGTIVLYMAKGNEVGTLEIMQQALEMKKKVLAPAIAGPEKMRISQVQDIENDLTRGAWGILEPKAHFADLSRGIKSGIVVVPGVVFDLSGGRIGYGKGYYDRFLNKLSGDVTTVGLCYCFQVEKVALPLWSCDISVDVIVTEEKVIRC